MRWGEERNKRWCEGNLGGVSEECLDKRRKKMSLIERNNRHNILSYEGT